MIPKDTVKPADLRKAPVTYNNSNSQDPLNSRNTANKLPLPIGVSSYKRAVDEYYYVDKTLMIKDILDDKPVVSLFTRPRRFGKTLNMDMLRTFFERTEKDNQKYFQSMKIWQCGEAYRQEQGRYPVIFLTFKDVKSTSWHGSYDFLKDLLRSEYMRHQELANSPSISATDFYQKIINNEAQESDYMLALNKLSQMLHEHYNVPPIIIIDEYDTPIQQGYLNGYYDEVVAFMRNLLSGGLKDNKHLQFAFLTGILRVAKESLFSGLNNLQVYSLLNDKYSSYFGFTLDEVKDLAAYYEADDKLEEIIDWYDGYKFGKHDIFNPWSVLNYLHNGCEPNLFWLSTGSHDIIGEVLEQADEAICQKLQALLAGESISTIINDNVIYPNLKDNPSAVFSFLLMAGYLKASRNKLLPLESRIYDLTIPNKEIAMAYKQEIIDKLLPEKSQNTYVELQTALVNQDAATVKTLLRQLLLEVVSYFDTASESFYQGLLLGLCAAMNGYTVTSNRESGDGRYDIQMMPSDKKLPGIIIELKADTKGSADLVQLAKEALQQIKEKNYTVNLQKQGIDTIFSYGVAFCG
ncbi:MAG: AAA family ATPase, partial [Phascolarctobacterium sp.]